LLIFFFYVNSYAVKLLLTLFERNFLLNVDTFKSCDLIGYNDSRRDLSKSFKTITWLLGLLCQLTHGWWVQSKRSVISHGLPTMRMDVLWYNSYCKQILLLTIWPIDVVYISYLQLFTYFIYSCLHILQKAVYIVDDLINLKFRISWK